MRPRWTLKLKLRRKQRLNQNREQVVSVAKESHLLMLSTTVEEEASLAVVLEVLVVHKAVVTGVVYLWQHQQASELGHSPVSAI